jgi:hypothetical protein
MNLMRASASLRAKILMRHPCVSIAQTVATVIVLCGAATRANAQTTGCAPLRADSLHKIYISNIQNFTSDPDSAWAASGAALGFPRVAASAITLVRTASVCKAAATAFAKVIPPGGSVPFSGLVYVYAVGPGHYYVVDPDYLVRPYMAYEALFTNKWVLVKRISH